MTIHANVIANIMVKPAMKRFRLIPMAAAPIVVITRRNKYVRIKETNPGIALYTFDTGANALLRSVKVLILTTQPSRSAPKIGPRPRTNTKRPSQTAHQSSSFRSFEPLPFAGDDIVFPSQIIIMS
jgi:hypothetical protein